MTPTLTTTVFELYRFYNLLNKHFYDGKLPQPVILVQSQGKSSGVLGWCTSREVWSDSKEGGRYYEIAIVAEFLQRPSAEIIETLLHEMVHLYNLQTGISDTSRNGFYHNKTFKNAAEAHGLDVFYSKQYGWAITSLSSSTKEMLLNLSIDEEAFRLFRLDDSSGEGKGKSHSIKYVCRMCGNSVRATKKVHILCIDCDAKMVDESEI